ncbi:EGF-like domain protein, partial [Ostertagia ostertagi]
MIEPSMKGGDVPFALLETARKGCHCRSGFTLADDGRSCDESLSGCQVANGGCQHDCYDQPNGSHVCKCRDGYDLGVDGKSCIEMHSIARWQSPRLVVGGYEDSSCLLNQGSCHRLCMDYRSNEIQCYCNAGYLLNEIDRHSCQDINECSVGNAGCSQLCINLPGSYECQCKSGYIMTYDGRTCEDINECVLNNGGCQHSCTNMPGGYKCSCEEGYRLAEDGHSCYDVNECLVNNGGCSQLCRNDEGGRHCECFGGYVLGKDEKTCM